MKKQMSFRAQREVLVFLTDFNSKHKDSSHVFGMTESCASQLR
jgi:hypothetical protein